MAIPLRFPQVRPNGVQLVTVQRADSSAFIAFCRALDQRPQRVVQWTLTRRHRFFGSRSVLLCSLTFHERRTEDVGPERAALSSARASPCVIPRRLPLRIIGIETPRPSHQRAKRSRDAIQQKAIMGDEYETARKFTEALF